MQLENKFLKDYRRMYRLLTEGVTFVALDTETTGLSAENCRIIEFGAVKFDQTGIVSKFNTLINPHEPIPYEITKITGINGKMLEGKPEFSEVAGKISEFAEGAVLIGHNVQFDLRFLKAEFERIGKTPLNNQVIDTLQFARWAFPEQTRFKQTVLAELLNIEVKNAHRAYDDAEVCGNIFLNLIKSTAGRQKI